MSKRIVNRNGIEMMMEDKVVDDTIAESITAASQKLEVDNCLPLKDYYELADDLLKQAGTHRKEKNFVDLYITLLRFQRLVMDTIPSHQDYKSKHRKQRHEFQKKAIYVVNELKSLKADGKCPKNELKTIPGLMDLVKNVGNLDATPLENPSANQVHGDVEESIATGTSHSSERGNVELDGAVSGCPSELDRAEVCPEGETSVQHTDNQSLKKEPELENPNLSREEASREWEINDEKGVYVQLQHAIADIATLKQEVYNETCERQKAEKNAIESSYNAVKHEKLYVREMRRRIKAEDVLLELILKLENLGNKNDVFDVLQERNERLEANIAELQDKLSEMEQLVSSLQVERDDALRRTQEIRGDEMHINTVKGPNVLEFSYLEIDQAVDNFDSSMKIMQSRHGNVYKGIIRNTMVTIKIPAPEFRLPQPVFLQEVTVISLLRHPNLVNLIGMCSDPQSLIYEFLPNGSLEDHLNGGDCSLLSWQVRISILADICTTLMFLHSCGKIHGNLKPSNILFDDHFFCKICDFRICHQGSNIALANHNNLLIESPYMDPEFHSNENVTIKSDIYSFGIIILQLLTGRPAFGIVEEVGFAIGKEDMDKILDKSAGEWPFVQVKQLLHLGLRCCETYSRYRPDLASDAWKVLEPMMRASSSCSTSILPRRAGDDVPSYFLCPILQEIMADPCVAADGFTYEAEALKAWINGGHDTSPMTNMKLSSKELIPNRALRSSIHEWLLKRVLLSCYCNSNMWRSFPLRKYLPLPKIKG